MGNRQPVEAGRAEARGDPQQDMPPQAMEAAPPPPPPPVGEQLEGVPVGAMNPEGMIEPQQPINEAESGNPQSQEAHTELTKPKSPKAFPKDMNTTFAIFFLIFIFYLCLGHMAKILINEYWWRGNGTTNESTPVTDMVFNVTTRMTNAIFNATTSMVDLNLSGTDTNI